MNILDVQDVIKWLIRTIIIVTKQYFGPFLPKLLRKFVRIDNRVAETKRHFPCLKGEKTSISSIHNR